MTTMTANPPEQNRAPLDYAVQVRPVSKGARVTGWIISAIPILMMGGVGAAMMLFNRAMMEQGMTKYGYPARTAVPVVIAEIACVILYAIPRTAVLGAVLLTGYLGGAVATHVHASEAWVFPVIAGVLVWLGLYLRDRRVRDLMPLRRPTN
jgi:DoxX-like protein